MQINNNINSMIQLEKKLEQSANALSKLNLNNEQTKQNNQKDINNNTLPQEDIAQETDMVQEMVKQIEIPIAYTANAQIISTQSSLYKSIIDIKA